MRALRWSVPAKADLDELWYHIAQDNLVAADEYLAGLELAALRHAQHPELG